MYIYDLDGTLNSLNSTFDFIKGYHKSRGFKFRISLAEFLRRVMNRLPLETEKKRKVLINLLFFGIPVDSLEKFYRDIYKEEFISALTELGKAVKGQDNSGNIMLTGCTSIPALAIADLFGFDMVVCTELSVYKGRVTGISLDTYGNKKVMPIKKLLTEKGINATDVTYYTDDIKSEDKLTSVFGTIKII